MNLNWGWIVNCEFQYLTESFYFKCKVMIKYLITSNMLSKVDKKKRTLILVMSLRLMGRILCRIFTLVILRKRGQ